MTKLPLIELKGSPYEIGIQHGKLLSSRIQKAITFYSSIFNKSEEKIFEGASHFKEIIKSFNPDYCTEIEAIAEGANVNPLWIYAINSRSEILTRFVSECTALYFPDSELLAQNWDWAEALEPLIVMMKIEREDGHKIMQITEPGMLGKIGLNSKGLGVTLNFLHMDTKLSGLPIHITLRHFLDSDTIESALDTLKEFENGKSGNIILGDSQGKMVNCEFANDVLYKTEKQEIFIHTNHFLGDITLNTDEVKLASSYSRFKKANELVVDVEQSVTSLKSILADKSNIDLPICRKYIPSEDIGDVGTVCSIIMDLKKLIIHATQGNPYENEYKSYSLN